MVDAPRKSASMWAELRPCSEFMRVFCRGIERVILIRESWVEVVTSTRPGDSITTRSSSDGCVTLVCIHHELDFGHAASSWVFCVWNPR